METRLDGNTVDAVDALTPDVPASEPVAPVATKPTRTRRTAVAVRRPSRIRTVADAVAIARTVTPANVDALTARHNANHGVTHAARNVGRLSGARVMAAQNVFMADNHGLNDLQIAFVLRIDFPMLAGKITTADYPTAVSIVRGIRAEYNRYGHGSTDDRWRTVKSVGIGPARFDWPKPAATKSA